MERWSVSKTQKNTPSPPQVIENKRGEIRLSRRLVKSRPYQEHKRKIRDYTIIQPFTKNGLHLTIIMKNNWKTTTVGFLTGTVLIVNSLVIPLLQGDWSAIDWTGTTTGLGALGLGWFAGDKGANKTDSPEDTFRNESDRAYEEWKNS